MDLLNEEDSEKFIASFIEKNETIDAAVLTVGGFAMGTIAETGTKDIVKEIYSLLIRQYEIPELISFE